MKSKLLNLVNAFGMIMLPNSFQNRVMVVQQDEQVEITVKNLQSQDELEMLIESLQNQLNKGVIIREIHGDEMILSTQDWDRPKG